MWPWVSGGLLMSLGKVAALIGRMWTRVGWPASKPFLPATLHPFATWLATHPLDQPKSSPTAMIFLPLTSFWKESQWEDCSSSGSYLRHHHTPMVKIQLPLRSSQWGPPCKKAGRKRKWKTKGQVSSLGGRQIGKCMSAGPGFLVEVSYKSKKWVSCPDLVALSTHSWMPVNKWIRKGRNVLV